MDDNVIPNKIHGNIIMGGKVTVEFTPTGGVTLINRNLDMLGFRARDADGNDFANPDYPRLRFKTGCAYGEVTTQVVREYEKMIPLRATSWAGIDHMLNTIREHIDGEALR